VNVGLDGEELLDAEEEEEDAGVDDVDDIATFVLTLRAIYS